MPKYVCESCRVAKERTHVRDGVTSLPCQTWRCDADNVMTACDGKAIRVDHDKLITECKNGDITILVGANGNVVDRDGSVIRFYVDGCDVQEHYWGSHAPL